MKKTLKVSAALVLIALLAIGGQWTYAAFNNSRLLLALVERCDVGCVVQALPSGMLFVGDVADACAPPAKPQTHMERF